MDEKPIQFFTNAKVKGYLDQLVKSGLYGYNLAEAVERIVCGTIEDMLASGQLEEIPSEEANG